MTEKKKLALKYEALLRMTVNMEIGENIILLDDIPSDIVEEVEEDFLKEHRRALEIWDDNRPERFDGDGHPSER